MSRPSKETKTASTLPDEITYLIAKARESVLGEILIEPFVARVLDTIVRAVEQNDSYTPSIAAIQKSIQDVEKLQAILRDMLKQVEALEVGRERRERFGERWWEQKRNELHDTFKKDPQEGLAEWLKTYAEALIAWELDICDKLANEPFPFPQQATDLSSLFQTGTQAIRDERYLEALDMLTYLTQADLSNQSQPILDQTSRAILFTLMGRISLYKSIDRERALKRFEQAKELAPNDGRPYAALGDYYRVENDSHQALRLYQQAIERSPDQPDGYIGMGLLSEDQKRWDEADEWYERAIETVRGEKDIEAGLSKLLVPSGNIYLYIARMFKKENPERALQAVIHAINNGIKQDGDYPERIGYKLKGEILETLQRPIESAEAYYEAGRRFGWRNENQDAVDLLTQANKLNPNHQPTYWYLSDAWRMRSYLTTPPYVDEKAIQESLDTWEKVAKPPDAEYSWAYITRALINEQLAGLPNANRFELYWEAIVYLERVLLLNERDPYSWAYLGRFHRSLETESNALQATSKALEYDSENLIALEERAAILANVGEFTEADEVIDKRRKPGSNAWVDGIKAYTLFYKQQYQASLELINTVIETDKTNVWNRDFRAYCYRMLDKPSLAVEDYRWIKERYDQSDIGNQSLFGLAFYKLDDIDKAIKIFSGMRDDPTDSSGNAYRNLGVCYLTRGDLKAGEEYLNEGIRRAINVRQLDDLVNIYLSDLEKSSFNWHYGDQARQILDRVRDKIKTRRTELERRPSAEEELEGVVAKLKSKGETDSWAWVGTHAGLARLYAEKKRWNDAVTNYQTLKKEPRRFPEAGIGLENVVNKLQEESNRLLEEGKTSEAVWLFQQAILSEKELSRPEKLAILQQRLGDALLKEGKSDEAINYYKDTIQKDPKVAAYRANLVLAYKQLGRLEEADKAYQEAINFDPDNPVYLNDLGNAFYGKGDYEKAAENYIKAIQKDPKAAVYYSSLGLAYRYLEKWNESIEAHTEAVRLEPDNATYLNYLGNAFYGKGNYEKALENYQKAIEKDPQVAVYHSNLGLAYNQIGNVFYRKGDYKKALENYKGAIEKDSKIAVYHANLGLAYAGLREGEEAEKAYLKAIELESDNPDYYNGLGNVLFTKGDYEKAAEKYKSAIEKDSKVAVYHANLILAYTELGEKKEAENAYTEAINVNPDNPAYLNELGNAFYQNWDYERAVEQYLKAIEINPGIEEYISNLIWTCEQFDVSNKDKAISFLESALRYNPNSTELAQAIQRLKTETQIKPGE